MAQTMKNAQELVEMNIEERVIRFNDFEPCKTAFIDARTPGSDKKENFCLIGGGVAENPGQIVHINIPHGFDIGAARQPLGCKNSHHSHDTEEVFMIFSGDWKFTWGQEGEDGQTVLSAGDTISIPTQVFRGFENVGEDNGFMYSVLGQDESGTAGHVVWAPYVFQQAKSHGLVLMEDGQLIDTVAGEAIPEDVDEYTPISKAVAAAEFRHLTLEDMLNCVTRSDEVSQLAEGGLSQFSGVAERAIIGCENELESIAQGKMAWEHGFHVRHLTIEPGAQIPAHTRQEEEVLIVQSGELTAEIDGQSTTLAAGDVFTAPVGSARTYLNNAAQPLRSFVVRRGNHPAAAQLL